MKNIQGINPVRSRARAQARSEGPLGRAASNGINQRTKSILEAAIKEYIKSGDPVSSKDLTKRYKFGVKDATIRNELNLLTKEGFLAQLHTSGGRVPTDKGYQFFVEETVEDIFASKKILSGRSNSALMGSLRKGNLRDLVEAFSEGTKLLGVGQGEKEIYKSGLEELFSQLDMETKEEMHEIIHDFDRLDERLHEINQKIFSVIKEPRVFIGNKSPITQSKHLSVIMDSYSIGDHKVLIAIIGPKRMDYDKNLKLFKLFHEYDE